jgi:hypothetical protein
MEQQNGLGGRHGNFDFDRTAKIIMVTAIARKRCDGLHQGGGD